MGIIDENLDHIRALCDKHKVSNLFVFGSILTNSFSKDSDVDFVVDFSGVDLYDYADNYFDFKDSLEALLKRRVDLLEEKAIKNPYLKNSIDSTKRQVYGSEH